MLSNQMDSNLWLIADSWSQALILCFLSVVRVNVFILGRRGEQICRAQRREKKKQCEHGQG